MKKLLCILLAVLLLSGCTAVESGQEETTNAAADSATILQQRRDRAEAHMRHMMSVLWQTDVDVVYSTHVNSLGVDMDEEKRIVRLEAGRIYSGMPYTHGSGCAEAFLGFGEPDEKGIYQLTGLTTDLLSGGNGTKVNNTVRLSNDCADAVCWAWSRVGCSFTFTVTQNMTAQYGCLPVGTYVFEGDTYKKTKEVAEKNGQEVMYSSYACLQKADAVVTYNGSGHAMMISQVNVVKNGDAIDPEQSYVLVLEQFTSNYKKEVVYMDETIGQPVYRLGGVDNKYTFAQLYKKGYLPVTIQEFHDPAPVPQPELMDSIENPDITNLDEGTISCLYKIGMVTVTITDQKGNVVQQASCFPKQSEHYMFRMANFTDVKEQGVLRGSLDVDGLPKGSYRCQVECLLGNGETLIARDFEFKIK